MILAYETSTNICSVAFQIKSAQVFEKRIQGRSVHSDNMFLFTQQLMEEHNFEITDLNAVLVSNGPGSYTGLRIAASGIKGLLFGTDIDLFAVNTLASFAMAAKNKAVNTIHSIIDARRTHVYHQSFTFDQELSEMTKAKVMELSELEGLIKPRDCVVGSGINRISSEALNKVKIFDDATISATTLIDLFESKNSEKFCIKTKAEDLNSNYISSSQVTNSYR